LRRGGAGAGRQVAGDDGLAFGGVFLDPLGVVGAADEGGLAGRQVKRFARGESGGGASL